MTLLDLIRGKSPDSPASQNWQIYYRARWQLPAILLVFGGVIALAIEDPLPIWIALGLAALVALEVQRRLRALIHKTYRYYEQLEDEIVDRQWRVVTEAVGPLLAAAWASRLCVAEHSEARFGREMIAAGLASDAWKEMQDAARIDWRTSGSDRSYEHFELGLISRRFDTVVEADSDWEPVTQWRA